MSLRNHLSNKNSSPVISCVKTNMTWVYRLCSVSNLFIKKIRSHFKHQELLFRDFSFDCLKS